MFLGIDLGTSDVKALLLSAQQEVVALQRAPLTISRAGSGWSEQPPDAWWHATQAAVLAIRERVPGAWQEIEGIGLSGQMHGAVVLDRSLDVLRPAMLWNDTRSAGECLELARTAPEFVRHAGNLIMPGFTAPKLLWLKRHEPALFRQIAMVMLPKDFLRLKLTGRCVSEMSDASGTLWLDIDKRDWSDEFLIATSMRRDQMPELVEGCAESATLSPALAQAWGLSTSVKVAGGAGDNAASAIGIGATEPGSGFVSLGTSGVVFVVTDRFLPNPDRAVHAFCHALPDRWHQMSVMLSAGASLGWLARLLERDEKSLIAALLERPEQGDAPFFMPYLGGERTPHNDADVRAGFCGLGHETDAAALTYAVLEGVTFGMCDGLAALRDAGTDPKRLQFVGGGTRSDFWVQLHADVLNLELQVVDQADHGAALGAARLGQLATGSSIQTTCPTPTVVKTFTPNAQRHARLTERYETWRGLYPGTLRSSARQPSTFTEQGSR